MMKAHQTNSGRFPPFKSVGSRLAVVISSRLENPIV